MKGNIQINFHFNAVVQICQGKDWNTTSVFSREQEDKLETTGIYFAIFLILHSQIVTGNIVILTTDQYSVMILLRTIHKKKQKPELSYAV